MLSTTEDTVPFYNDGPEPPVTELQQKAERAYRAGYSEAASLAARERMDEDEGSDRTLETLIERFTQLRHDVRRQYERWLPSLDRVVYLAGHEVDASRARGQAHGIAEAQDCWWRLLENHIDPDAVIPLVLEPWSERVSEWASSEIDPGTITPPPSPEECISAEARIVLNNLRSQGEAEAAKAEEQEAEYARADEARKANLRAALPARSVAELLRKSPNLKPPVIHGLLREGETMNIIASPKTGKSWLVTDLALSVATGRPWLETFQTVRGDVLVIDNELHPETSAHRIPKVMDARGVRVHQVGRWLTVANLRGRLVDINGLGERLENLSPGQFKLIVLDAFYRFMPIDTDENDNGAMANVYNLLDRCAKRLGCAFVLIHHTTKGSQSGKAVTDVGAGAGAQSRAADTHLILRPHEESDCVVLDAAVRSWTPIHPRVLRWTFPVWNPDDSLDPAALRQDRPNRRGRAVDEEKAQAPVWDAPRFAKAFVSESPKAIQAIVQAATSEGLSERKARELLKLAQTDGLVHRWYFGSNVPVGYASIPQPENPS